MRRSTTPRVCGEHDARRTGTLRRALDGGTGIALRLCYGGVPGREQSGRADVVVRRNDALDVQEAMGLNPAAIILSPGPCDPDQAGICLALTAAAAETRTPLLGVCLGHQTIGQAFGGKVVRANKHSLVGRVESCSLEGDG